MLNLDDIGIDSRLLEIKKPMKYDIYIAKPNKQIIGKIINEYDVNLSLKFGSINELSLTIPYKLYGEKTMIKVDTRFDELLLDIDNFSAKENIPISSPQPQRNIETIEVKELMYIKLVYMGKTEWFLIDSINDEISDKDEMSIKCYSIPYELKRKKLSTPIEMETTTISGVVDKLLQDTGWKIGSIDGELSDVYRTITLDGGDRYSNINEVAQSYGTVLIWDTVNKQLNISLINNISQNKGLIISSQNLLNSLSRERTTENVITRMYGFGNDDLTFENVNPTGKRYIEDFSFFIYPFKRDVNKNVLLHSSYMSDELAHALLDIEELSKIELPKIKEKQSQIISKNTQLSTVSIELIDTKGQRGITQGLLDIAKSTQDIDLITQRKYELKALDDKIVSLEAQEKKLSNDISTLQLEISNIQKRISYTALSQELIDELYPFIIDGEFKDDRYIDETDLFNDTKKEFIKNQKPKQVISVDLSTVLQDPENVMYRDKINLGDIATIKYPDADIDYQEPIVGIDIKLDTFDIEISVSEHDSDLSPMDKLASIIYNTSSSIATFEGKEHKWDAIVNIENEVDKMRNGIIDATKNRIVAGVNESVDIGDRGIIIKNPDYPQNILIMQSGVFALSKDGGETWQTAISPDGVMADTIIGRLLVGNELIIANESGTFKIDGNGLEVDIDSIKIMSGTEGSKEDILSSWNTTINRIAEMANDNVLNEYEKNQLQKQFDAETKIFNDMTKFYISTIGTDGVPSQEYTNLINAYSDMNNLLTKELQSDGFTILDILNRKVTTEVDGVELDRIINNYYASKDTFLTKTPLEFTSTAIKQTMKEISLNYVKNGEVVNEINLSEDGVKIDGSKIEISGDTTFKDDLIMDTGVIRSKDGTSFVLDLKNNVLRLGKTLTIIGNIFVTPSDILKDIIKTEYLYGQSSSPTITPTTWSKATPIWKENMYIWEKKVQTLRDGTVNELPPVNITGAKGTTGASGKDGLPGVDGKPGIGISKTVIDYAGSTSGTIAPTTGYTTTVPTVAPGNFLWTRTTWTYTDATTETSYSVGKIGKNGNTGADGNPGKDGVGIQKTLIEYAKNTSGTFKPTTGWSTTIPSTVPGDFLWTRTTWTYTDTTSEQGYTVGKIGNTGPQGPQGPQGADGAPGKNGVGIVSTTIAYAVNQSGTTKPTAGWSGTVPKTNPGDYIWTKITWNYTDNTAEDAYSVGRIGVDGPDGDDGLPGAPGVGIKMTTITYTKSTSGTVIPPSTATWSPTPPAGNPGEFIWTRTVWTYTNNDTETGYSVGMIGKTGPTGPQGIQGASGKDGLPGSPGVGIKSTTITYGVNQSNVTKPTNWAPNVPESNPGDYVWTKTEWIYTNNTKETGYSVSRIGKDGNTGEDGIPGMDGVGIEKTTITYAKNTNGTTAPTTGWGAQVPTTNPGDFVWTKTEWLYTNGVTETGYSVGKIGNTGSQGVKGADGKSTHIAYANSADGTLNFSTSDGTNKKYIGIYVDTNATDSSDPSKYTWTLVKGADGANGLPGKPGENGLTPYFHVAYANSADGTLDFDIADSTNRAYLGQYTDFKKEDSTNPSDYTWTRIKGEDGGGFTWNMIKGSSKIEHGGMPSANNDATYVNNADGSITYQTNTTNLPYATIKINGLNPTQIGLTEDDLNKDIVFSVEAKTDILTRLSTYTGFTLGGYNLFKEVDKAVGKWHRIWFTNKINAVKDLFWHFSNSTPNSNVQIRKPMLHFGTIPAPYAPHITETQGEGGGGFTWNLLKDTKNYKSSNWNQIITKTEDLNGENVIKWNIIKASSTNATVGALANDKIRLKPNTTYVYQAEFYSSEYDMTFTATNFSILHIQLWSGTTRITVPGILVKNDLIKKGTWGTFALKFTTTSDANIDAIPYIYGTGNALGLPVDTTIYVKNLKLSETNAAADWSPHSSEIQGQDGKDGVGIKHIEPLYAYSNTENPDFEINRLVYEEPNIMVRDFENQVVDVNGNFMPLTLHERTDYIKINPSDTINFFISSKGSASDNGFIRYGFYSVDKVLISREAIEIKMTNHQRVAPSNASYIVVSAPKDSNTTVNINGNTITKYYPHISKYQEQEILWTSYGVGKNILTNAKFPVTHSKYGDPAGPVVISEAEDKTKYKLSVYGRIDDIAKNNNATLLTMFYRRDWKDASVRLFIDSLENTWVSGVTGSPINLKENTPYQFNSYLHPADKADMGKVTVEKAKVEKTFEINGKVIDLPYTISPADHEARKTDYLWERQMIIFTDGGIRLTEPSPVHLAKDGAPGKGIKDTRYRYAKTSTPSPEPTESQWSPIKPDYNKGDYAWTQVIWEYSDGTVENSAPMMSYIAEDGVGISDTLVAYALSTTNVQPADNLFTPKVPDSKPGDYVWTRVTLDYTDPSKTDSKFYTVARVGRDGVNAKLISLSASEQVFKNNTPATITVTGLAQNTSITSWTYSSNSGAFTATLPAGVTRSGNTVTITQSTMTANTLTIKASDGTYSDTVSIAKLADGTSGTDGFTVLLTNESQTFPANSAGTVTSYASGYSDIVVYYGGTPLTCTTTATGLPTVNNTYTVTAITASAGTVTLTPSLVSSNYRVTPSALTTDNAIRVLTIVARVNNTNYTFKKTLTYTKSKSGANGADATIASTTPPTDTNKLWRDLNEGIVKQFNETTKLWEPFDATIAKELEDYKDTVGTSISQANESTLITIFESVYTQQTIDDLIAKTEGTISDVEGNAKSEQERLQDLIDSNKQETDDEFGKIGNYFDFLDEGLMIGKKDNPVNVLIDNDSLSFYDKGVEVAWFTNEELHVTDTVIERSLSLGNFEFVPRESGNLSFRKKG